jgi:hypothetical protein
MVAQRCSLTSDVFRSLDLAAALNGKTIASTPGCPEGLHASDLQQVQRFVTAGWTAERASSEMCYRTKYIRSELPRTTSPTIGTIDNQLVHACSANRGGIK